jgi:hypothetical protein
VAVSPNFFIVGAPKCGTTALYRYLRPHPGVFMPKIKEPHFFARDLDSYPRIKSLEDYRGLFMSARPEHLAVGEASVYYLRSTVALANIRAFNPEARIIAMFRNPVEMVYSLHSQLLFMREENEPEFERAWRLQERRRQGLDLPPRVRSPQLVQYAEIGRFGTQVQRVLASFPADQVKLILYDEFAASPRVVYDDVLAFLDLPHDGRSEFPRINENKRARLSWLSELYRKPPVTLHRAFRGLKRALGSETVTAVRNRIVDLNTARAGRDPLSPELRAELVDTFREEVALLGRIMGRDLSHWSRTA